MVSLRRRMDVAIVVSLCVALVAGLAPHAKADGPTLPEGVPPELASYFGSGWNQASGKGEVRSVTFSSWWKEERWPPSNDELSVLPICQSYTSNWQAVSDVPIPQNEIPDGGWVIGDPCTEEYRWVELPFGPTSPAYSHEYVKSCTYLTYLEGKPPFSETGVSFSGARQGQLPDIFGIDPRPGIINGGIYDGVLTETTEFRKPRVLGGAAKSNNPGFWQTYWDPYIDEVLDGTWWVFWRDDWCGSDWEPPEEEELEAVCEVDQTPNEPGSFRFDATGSVGDGLVYEWDFGDGETGTGFLESHRYTLPGSYTATVTITDQMDQSASATCEVEVEAPELEIVFSYPDRESLPDGSPDMSFALDDEVTIRVHLRATDGVGALSEVAFVDDPLRSAPTTAWELDLSEFDGEDDDGNGGDEGEAGRVLEPGDEVTFDVPAKAVEPGGFSFLSTAVAVDAAGEDVGPVEMERSGRIGELDVEVVVDPSVVELEEGEDEEGPEPEPVTVSVTVTNPFDQPITDVVLEMNQPRLVTNVEPPLGYRAFTYLVGDPEEPDADPTEATPDEVELGDLGPGASVTHDFDGLALARGEVVLRALARAAYDHRTVTGVGDGELEVVTDVLFAFDADIDPASHELRDGAPWVNGGNDWRIDGTLENRTHDETFEVVVLPFRTGNAGFGVPRELLDAPITDECVVGVSKIVEPGETIEWSAPVHTAPSGGTRSQVNYAPQVYLVNEDGSRALLADENVLVTAGSDEHLMHVDTRDLEEVQPGAGELIWTFSHSAAETFEESFIGLLDAASEVLQLGLQPWEWPAAYEASADRMVEYLDTIYQNLSPADQAAWRESLAATIVIATGMALTDASDLANQMALESFTELNHAWVTGDRAGMAEWMGRQVGANPDIAMGALVKAAATCKLLSRQTPWAQNALAAKEAKVANELAALGNNVTAANIPTGSVVTRVLRRNIWGIDDAMHAKVQAFVNEFGISIGVRRRGPGAIAKIEAGTHNPKPFHNKAKNASALDVQWMRFVNDIDTAAIKQPPPISEVRASLDAANASPDLRAEVLARHQTRNKEWYGKAPSESGPAYEAWLENGAGADFTKSERYKWAQFSVPVDRGGGIPVPKKGAPLDYRTNVSAGRSLPSDDVLYQRAPARIRTEIAPDGRPQMVLETDRGGGFKPDTGDMDPLVVTKADLSALPEGKRIAFYYRAHELGFEHVESASWNNPAGRNAYLMEHAIAAEGRPMGEAMFQWIPNSAPRATRFDPQRSWYEPGNELLAARTYLHGADVYLKVADPVANPSYTVAEDDYAGYITPRSSLIFDPECLDGGTSGQPDEQACSVTFDRGEDAIVFRQVSEEGTGTIEIDGIDEPVTQESSKLQAWTLEGGWQDHDVTEAGDVPILPQSVLTDGAAAGTTRLPIATADDLDLVVGEDAWFAVGDQIVIDPGGAHQELAMIAGFGSLLVAEPLEHDHAPGTLVSVVTPLGDPNSPRDPNGPWPTSTTVPPGTGGSGSVGETDDDEPAAPGEPSCEEGSGSYPDVPQSAAHADAISCAATLGIFSGRVDGTFDPAGHLSRGQAATVLWRILDGLGVDLPDLEPTDGTAHARTIASLTAAGVISGYPDGSYRASQPVTRQQLASMIDRASNLLIPYANGDHPGFVDLTSGPHRAAVQRLAAAKIVHGLAPDGMRFGPNDPIRRDQTATLLVRWHQDQRTRRRTPADN